MNTILISEWSSHGYGCMFYVFEERPHFFLIPVSNKDIPKGLWAVNAVSGPCQTREFTHDYAQAVMATD